MTDRSPGVVVSAFTAEEARRLTGISLRQLGYWQHTDFFAPSIGGDALTGPLYSFRDLVALQVLNALRNEARISLPHLREVKDDLAHLGDDMWAKTTLYVLNRKVVFLNPDTDNLEEVTTGQTILQIPLQVVSANMRERVGKLWQRDESTLGKVQRRKGVVHNRPVVAGTRVQVSSIKAFAEAGYSVDRILREYPSLTEEDVKAAIAYAAAA